MPGRAKRWGRWFVAAVVVSAACSALAQGRPMYKCVSQGRGVYQQTQCGDAKPLNSGKPRVNVRYETPSQDRAKAARRAPLTAEARQECSGLDTRMKELEAQFKAKGEVTPEEEIPLTRSKKRYRELKC